MSSAAGKPVIFWYWLNVTLPIAHDHALAHTASKVHLWTAWTLIAVIAIHIFAALKHHYIDKDNVLKRMLPFIK
jgi:cytochrome b561